MCNNKACQLMLLSYFQHPNNKLEKLVCCIVLGDSLLRVEHHMQYTYITEFMVRLCRLQLSRLCNKTEQKEGSLSAKIMLGKHDFLDTVKRQLCCLFTHLFSRLLKFGFTLVKEISWKTCIKKRTKITGMEDKVIYPSRLASKDIACLISF